MSNVNQIPRRTFEGQPVDLQQHYLQLTDTVNALLGYMGEVPIKAPINLNGNKITGVGTAESDSDVLTLATGNSNYGPAVMRAALEANGSNPLQSVRRMNDRTQREQNSTFLTSLYSTPPSANNIQVLFSSPGGGMTTITLPASLFYFADGSNGKLNALTLTVSNPGTFTIAASPTGAVSTGTTATITTTAPSGVAAGTYVTIAGVTDTDFNGFWLVATVGPGNQFTFATTIAAASSGGGTVTTAGVYYFFALYGNPNPQYIGVSTTADSPFNRLPTSTDGRQLIAIATVNASGGVSSSSAGGGTPGSTLNAGSFF